MKQLKITIITKRGKKRLFQCDDWDCVETALFCFFINGIRVPFKTIKSITVKHL